MFYFHLQLGGAKKGVLGATKVKANFADLEQQANMADQQQPEKVPEQKLTEEQEVEQLASMRLAYQDLSLKAQKQEEKMKTTDPKKAKQMERLGMGFNVRGDVSHSAISDMKTIAQEPTPAPKFSTKIYDKEPKDDFFDDYPSSMYRSMRSTSKQNDDELAMMGFETIEPIETSHSNISTMFSASQQSDNERSEPNKGNRGASKSTATKYNTYENEDAQKKFGGAKSISSEQFFGDEATSFERAANLSKFQGSNSISSSDYFNEPRPTSQRGKQKRILISSK